MSDFSDERFLIIAGQPKAGTTSVFDWLSGHPEIRPSTLKEARFFLDSDYPLNRPYSYDGSNVDRYAALYPPEGGAVFMEASPDYMYSDGFAEIAHVLPQARIVVLIREPLPRLLSAYNFFRQRGLLDIGFDEWIARQDAQELTPSTPVAFRALDHCDLETYLPPLRAAFGERLLEICFEDLHQNPLEVANRICAHAGIAPLERLPENIVSNRSHAPKWPAVSRVYNRMRRAASQQLLAAPGIRNALRPLSKRIQRGLSSDARPEEIVPDAQSLEIISRYANSADCGGEAGKDRA